MKIENSRDAWIILADILGGSVHTALSQLTAFGDVTILSEPGAECIAGRS